jgi:molybdenum cofactor cytidylyltransferase
MFLLAREVKPAIVTATTHLARWQSELADRHFVWEDGGPMPDLDSLVGKGVTLVTGTLDAQTDRHRGLSLPQMEGLRELAGSHDLPLLIEADGARQKALKAPAAHEPAIPEFVETAVVMAGLSALEPANVVEGQGGGWEQIHRPEIFAQVAGISMGDRRTPEVVVRVLAHPQGGLKGIPPNARRIALLNQADMPALQAAGAEIAHGLISTYEAVIVSSLGGPADSVPSIFAVHEKIAGIILAAGESRRFGQTKQLLDFHGRPFVRAVAEKALTAGLDPVIVVTGCDAESVEQALAGLPLQIVRNAEWPSGQASSIRAGLARIGSLPPAGPSSEDWGDHSLMVGAAIFLLADMPQVTAEVLRALVEAHARELPPVLAPMVEDRRTNPVLFDRVTFPDLGQLTGDVGGRAIFSRYSPVYLPWLDDALLRDVDTPDDYRKLLIDE